MAREDSLRWAPLVLAAVAGFAFQGDRGIYETTEGRYALCAREMADGGAWLEPTLGGKPHWTKPPAAYWAIAAGIRLAGRNPWGARLPIACAFVLTTLAVAALGRAIGDRTKGALAGTIYATSLYPAMVAWTVNADTVLGLWEVLAVLCFFRAERAARAARARLWIAGLWAALGAGFLTKGPPALIPLIPVGLYRLGDPDGRRKPRVLDPLGLVVFLVVGCSWYAVEAARHPGLLRYFLHDEVVGRVATTMHQRGTEWYYPIKVYAPVLLAGGGPWALWLFAAVRRRGLFRPASWRAVARARSPAWFLALWVAVPFAIFSLAQSRMPNYLLPLYAPVALAVAGDLRSLWGRESVRRRIALTAAAGLALVLGVKISPRFLPPSPRDMTALWRAVREDEEAGRRLAFYEVRGGYGLDFHAARPVARTYLEPPEGATGSSIGAFLEALSTEEISRRGLVFLAREEDEAGLVEALLARGVSEVSVAPAGRWIVARVGAPGRSR